MAGNFNGTYQAKLNASWKDWIHTNLTRGIPRAALYEKLRQQGFGLGAIKDGMGTHYPDIPVDEHGRDSSGRTTAYEQLANCALTRRKADGLRRVLTAKAQVYLWDNFLSEDDCDTLIELTNSQLHDSTISTAGKEKDYAFRTSKTCYLQEFDHPLVTELDTRMSSALGISEKWSEPNQSQKYTVGQEFKAHTDYFEPGTEEYQQFCTMAGQRTWTFMIYLNEGCEGGGTRFRKLDKIFTPTKGRAVIWNSLTVNGDPNPLTIHHGTKVRSGEKYVITKWFRDMGEGPAITE
ncbi:2OG-Fe(II) oxygenase [Hirschia litorea]|uniref:2OG-Fe(II) oxygenase n=1 Tax=Hirschia litorea TaxID=1199156 RepID=A0ABW2IK04_9PROT